MYSSDFELGFKRFFSSLQDIIFEIKQKIGLNCFLTQFTWPETDKPTAQWDAKTTEFCFWGKK